MTITDGEGQGSVVETHATPLEPGRTAIVEATLASSARRGFALARRSAPFVRPLIEWAAGRLWRDDAAYAERRYAVRTAGSADPPGLATDRRETTRVSGAGAPRHSPWAMSRTRRDADGRRRRGGDR